MRERQGVLFIQSQEFFGADSMIHSLLMQHLDRERYTVHVACNPRSGRRPSKVWKRLAAVEDVRLVPANFGPSVFGRSLRARLRVAPSGIASLVTLVRLSFYVRRNRVTVIHATEKPRDALVAVLLGKLTGARSVIHLHVKYHEALTRPARWALTHSDFTVGVSQFVEDSARANGSSKGRVGHVLNAIDPPRPPAAIYRQAVREELGIGESAVVMSIVSRIFAWKGHRELVLAFAKISADLPDAILLIVGEDDPRANPGGGALSRELARIVHEHGLDGRVIFTGFRSDIPAVMAATDIFTMPSFEEPFGVVFLEAMVQGRPVIALNNGGTVQVVEHGATGLLSEPGDIDEMARNLRRLACDPELRARLGQAGCARVHSHFTPQRMTRDMERIYERVLTGSR